MHVICLVTFAGYMAELDKSFNEVVSHSAEIITSTRLDDYVLDVFGTSVEALKNVGIVRPGEDIHLTWPEAAMRLFDYDLSDDQKDELIAKAMQTHQAISTAMAAHLALTAENISRSTWLSARMLSKKRRVCPDWGS